ncbi:hypothetical protein DACRYDRAFT_53366, partial [Dacryopinax primogenitus]
NLCLCAILPGLTEPSHANLQQFLGPFVDDLLLLYTTGIKVRTLSWPQGRLVCVAVVGLICDHPALCKVTGFAEHASTMWPCTKCDIQRSEISMFSNASCRPWDCVEHKQHAWVHQNTLEANQDEYARKHGVWWSEFNRLLYFDPIMMGMIDLMDSLLLSEHGFIGNQS